MLPGLPAIQFTIADPESVAAGGIGSGTTMVDAAYCYGLKPLDESVGQAGVRGMSKDFAVSLHTANDTVVKEPTHELMTIIVAASGQMVRLGRDRFRCWQMSCFIHTQFHKIEHTGQAQQRQARFPEGGLIKRQCRRSPAERRIGK